MRNVIAIARLELRGSTRLRWVRLLTAAFALLSAAAAYSAGAAAELSGADGFARTAMALVPVVLILVPLAAVILGVSGQSAEAGSESFLFAQPISRATVVAGRWLGELAALAGAIVLGFGLGAVVIALGTGADGFPSYAILVVASVILAAIFLAMASAIAAASDKRATALGIAIFAWFFFVLLYDGIALSVAGWLTGPAGGRVLFVSVFGSPVDLIRVGALLLSGTSSVLGAAGDAWTRFLGGEVRASVTAAIAIALWTVAPLAAGIAVLRTRDL